MGEEDIAEDVGIRSTPSLTSSQSSEDGSAEAVVVKSEPVTKEPESTGSSPIAILNIIRPGLQYFKVINSKNEALNNSTGHRMGIVVDGQRFEGSASNKKLSRCYAAEAALKTLFGLEFARSSDGTPVFTGDPNSLPKVNKAKHQDHKTQLEFDLPKGKHPLGMINELYPTVMYSYQRRSTLNISERVSAHIKIEGMTFEGMGSKNKSARVNAAIKALTFLKTSGLLEQRISEKTPQFKTMKPNPRRPPRPAFLNRSGKPFFTPKLTEEKPMDAVQKLKEMFGKIDYQVVSESTVEDDEGEAVMKFVVSAAVRDKTFTGCGTSKQEARLAAAESAARGLDLWTDEDETLKEDTKRLEAERARFAPMLYGSKRTRGSGGGESRDWQSHGKSWVSGGVHAPNPLILPDSKDEGSGGNFDEKQQSQSQYESGHSMGGQQNDFGMGPPNWSRPHNEYGMGPVDNYGMGSSKGYGMGPSNGYGMGQQNDYGMGPSNAYGVGQQNDYGFQMPGGFGMGGQSGYGMGQSADFGGSYSSSGNGGNFSENQSGSYSNWWGGSSS